MRSINFTMPTLPMAQVQRFVPLGLVTFIAVGCATFIYIGVREPAVSRLEQAEIDVQTAKQHQEQLHRTRALQEKARTAQRQVEAVWKGLPTHNEFASFAMAISEMGKLEGQEKGSGVFS
jgi:Tfp pilus assembly protein PilO